MKTNLMMSEFESRVGSHGWKGSKEKRSSSDDFFLHLTQTK